MRLWTIGDVHGYSLALQKMLDLIEPQPDDTIVMLGNYIDRGPDSRGVIDRLLKLRNECHCITLRGNHEEMLLNLYARQLMGNFQRPGFMGFVKKVSAYLSGKYKADMVGMQDWLLLGGRQTLSSYGYDVRRIDQIPKEHLDFMRDTELYYETEHFLFTHAAYVPNLPMDEQPREALLYQRLRRSIPAPHCSGKPCYVGHTSQKNGEILDCGHIRCIDTYLYGGGWLTAVEVNSGQILQVDASGNRRE